MSDKLQQSRDSLFQFFQKFFSPDEKSQIMLLITQQYKPYIMLCCKDWNILSEYHNVSDSRVACLCWNNDKVNSRLSVTWFPVLLTRLLPIFPHIMNLDRGGQRGHKLRNKILSEGLWAIACICTRLRQQFHGHTSVHVVWTGRGLPSRYW